MYVYIYIYIHIYISYLQLSNKSPIAASRNGGGRWVIRWQQQQMQKQSPHGNHMCTSHTVQAYQKLQPSYQRVWLWTVSRYNKYIHVTAIAQSNVYRSEHNSIILNVILTLILPDVVYYEVSFMCTTNNSYPLTTLKIEKKRGGRSYAT
jgi:hypothetical protein